MSSRARRARAAAGLAALLVLAGCDRGPRPPHGIVLVVVDTLRADRLPFHGHDRDTAPALARIAAEGVVFEQAYSHTSWTLPAFVGLLGGAYPRHSLTARRLEASLVEALRRSGRATAAFTEGGYVSAVFGMDAGFDHFESREAGVRLNVPGAATAPSEDAGVETTFAAGMDWLRAHADAPFFLLLHTYEVHMPYRHRHYAASLERGSLPEEYGFDAQADVTSGKTAIGEREAAYVRALYDGGIRAVDAEIDRLDALLAELGVRDDTLFLLTADHGEELGERTLARLAVHGTHLYDTLLHVPLVLRWPARVEGGRRIATQVRLVDVLPTALDYAGVALPAGLDGRSLAPVLDGREHDDRPAYAELFRPGGDTVARVALRDDGAKLIVNAPPIAPDESPAELYAVATDPGERANRAADEPARKAALEAALREIRAARAPGAGTVPAAPPTDAVRERLRALGYAE